MGYKKRIAVLLIGMLLVLTGCQSVGGVDLAGLINQSVKVTSGETHSTLGIKLQVRPDADLTKEDKDMLAIINGIQLDVTTKSQADGATSIGGSVKWNEKTLAFQITADKKQVVATVEGAKAPIVLPLDVEEFNALSTSLLSGEGNEETLKKLQQSAISFYSKHAPNMKRTTVSSVQEPIFGQSESLHKVHVEVGANDLLGWVEGLLNSVVADEKGMTAFIKEIEAMYATLYEEESEWEEAASSTDDDVAAELFADLKDNKDELITEMKTAWKEAQQPDSEYATLFSDKTNLKVDVFADTRLNVKKLNMELNVALPDVDGNPIEGFSVHAMTEMRKHNESVEIDSIDTTNAVNLLEKQLTPGQWLRHFEGSSAMSELLQGADVTHKYFVLSLDDDEYGEWVNDYPSPYVSNGITMAPLRIVAETLDADVKWISKSNQVRIVDDITGKVIIVTIGSKQATVDGIAVQLSVAPTMKDGAVFIPVRNIVELLGAEIGYEQSEYGSYITIERD